jgi:Uma2 family endonuclease
MSFVLRDPNLVAADIDWSQWHFPDEDDLPSSAEHLLIINLFLACLTTLFQEAGRNEFLGRDIFFSWVKQRPNVRVAPDVFVSPHGSVPMKGVIETWKTGRKPPLFALEVVSEDRKKDYEHIPDHYAVLGANELVVFDPAALRKRSRTRRLLAVYRRQEDGAFAQVYVGKGPVRSETLGAWLVPVEVEGVICLRLARDEQGKALIPTVEEARDVERMRADASEARVRALEEKLKQLARK